MMKNLILSSVLILLTLNLASQDENKRNLSAGFHFNPNVLFRVELGKSYAGAPSFDNFPAMGYTFGLSFSTSINKKLQFETGIYEYQRSIDIDDWDSWAETAEFIFPRSDTLVLPYRKDIDYYFVLPLSLKYEIISWPRTSFYIKPGLNLNILYKTLYLSTPRDNHLILMMAKTKFSDLIHMYDFRTISPSLSFSVGATQSIAENIDLQIECISDYMFYLHYKEFKFNDWNHFNTGMKVGINYKF
jgi:hypothetical protein